MRPHRVRRAGLLDHMVDRQKTDFALHAKSNVLVYLIHGVTGTPAEMFYVARELARKNGWDIYTTTLPGHCTRLEISSRPMNRIGGSMYRNSFPSCARSIRVCVCRGSECGGALGVRSVIVVRGRRSWSPLAYVHL